jgi:hypothetical protein
MNINIPFDKNWKNIAISLSGGADSALLSFLVCSMITESDVTIHIINHIRCWKTRPWQQNDATRVYNWLSNRFNNITFKRHTNFIPPELEYGSVGPNLTDEYGKKVSGDNIEKRSYAEFICFNEQCEVYYNGVTRNPPQAFFNRMIERDIEPTKENKHLEYTIHMGIIASHPFRFVDKSWIMLKYKELDLQELLDITRSCEGEFKDLNYKNYTPGQYVPICNNCFWCKERAWAIEQTK